MINSHLVIDLCLFFLYISTFSTEKLIINTLPHVENSRNHVENLFSLHKSSFEALFQVIQVPYIILLLGTFHFLSSLSKWVGLPIGSFSRVSMVQTLHTSASFSLLITPIFIWFYALNPYKKIQNIKKKSSVFGLFSHR